MPEFKPNQAISQPDPVVKVEVSNNAPLPAGLNRFQLIVVDDTGVQSDPVIIEIMVRRADKPTAVLDLVNADGKRIDPPAVTVGQSFILSGARSSDVAPGKIVEYRFMLVGPS